MVAMATRIPKGCYGLISMILGLPNRVNPVPGSSKPPWPGFDHRTAETTQKPVTAGHFEWFGGSHLPIGMT